MPQMAFSHGPIVTTLTMTFMSALPREVNLDPHRVSAWNMLLAAEEAALKKDTGTSAKYRNELVGVRILGFFLLNFYKHSYHQIGLIPYSVRHGYTKPAGYTDTGTADTDTDD